MVCCWSSAESGPNAACGSTRLARRISNGATCTRRWKWMGQTGWNCFSLPASMGTCTRFSYGNSEPSSPVPRTWSSRIGLASTCRPMMPACPKMSVCCPCRPMVPNSTQWKNLATWSKTASATGFIPACAAWKTARRANRRRVFVEIQKGRERVPAALGGRAKAVRKRQTGSSDGIRRGWPRVRDTGSSCPKPGRGSGCPRRRRCRTGGRSCSATSS